MITWSPQSTLGLGFVLPFKDRSNLRRKAAENHIGCVDNVPLAFHFAGLCHIRLIVFCHCRQILSHCANLQKIVFARARVRSEGLVLLAFRTSSKNMLDNNIKYNKISQAFFSKIEYFLQTRCIFCRSSSFILRFRHEFSWACRAFLQGFQATIFARLQKRPHP